MCKRSLSVLIASALFGAGIASAQTATNAPERGMTPPPAAAASVRGQPFPATQVQPCPNETDAERAARIERGEAAVPCPEPARSSIAATPAERAEHDRASGRLADDDWHDDGIAHTERSELDTDRRVVEQHSVEQRHLTEERVVAGDRKRVPDPGIAPLVLDTPEDERVGSRNDRVVADTATSLRDDRAVVEAGRVDNYDYDRDDYDRTGTAAAAASAQSHDDAWDDDRMTARSTTDRTDYAEQPMQADEFASEEIEVRQGEMEPFAETAGTEGFSTGATAQTAEQRFNRLDTDNSGELTREQLQGTELAERIDEYDINNDGTISQNEFQSWFAAQRDVQDADVDVGIAASDRATDADRAAAAADASATAATDPVGTRTGVTRAEADANRHARAENDQLDVDVDIDEDDRL